MSNNWYIEDARKWLDTVVKYYGKTRLISGVMK